MNAAVAPVSRMIVIESVSKDTVVLADLVVKAHRVARRWGCMKVDSKEGVQNLLCARVVLAH